MSSSLWSIQATAVWREFEHTRGPQKHSEMHSDILNQTKQPWHTGTAPSHSPASPRQFYSSCTQTALQLRSLTRSTTLSLLAFPTPPSCHWSLCLHLDIVMLSQTHSIINSWLWIWVYHQLCFPTAQWTQVPLHIFQCHDRLETKEAQMGHY